MPRTMLRVNLSRPLHQSGIKPVCSLNGVLRGELMLIGH